MEQQKDDHEHRMTCRICLEDQGELISPCNCAGTCANVHIECLQKWINTNNATTCEICMAEYNHILLPTTENKILDYNIQRLTTVVIGLSYGCILVVPHHSREWEWPVVELILFNSCHFAVWAIAYNTNRKEMYISILWLCSVTFAMTICLCIFDDNQYLFRCYVTNVIFSVLGTFLHTI